jgi:hypothetical protein
VCFNGVACETNRFSCFPLVPLCRPFLRGENPPKAIPSQAPFEKGGFFISGKPDREEVIDMEDVLITKDERGGMGRGQEAHKRGDRGGARVPKWKEGARV